MNRMRCIALLATWSLFAMATAASATIKTRPTSFWTLSSTPFSVGWTAPGDDSMTGRASVYDLRYSNFPITATNFSQATRILGLPTPSVAGTPQTFLITGLPDTGNIYLAIKSADEVGNWSGISNILKRTAQVGVDPPALALSFSSPWPNPARTSVTWGYSLPGATHIQVDVFDVRGRHVHTVASDVRGAGNGNLSWDLRDDHGGQVATGIYFVKARLGVTGWTHRLVVVR